MDKIIFDPGQIDGTSQQTQAQALKLQSAFEQIQTSIQTLSSDWQSSVRADSFYNEMEKLTKQGLELLSDLKDVSEILQAGAVTYTQTEAATVNRVQNTSMINVFKN